MPIFIMLGDTHPTFTRIIAVEHHTNVWHITVLVSVVVQGTLKTKQLTTYFTFEGPQPVEPFMVKQ